MPHSLIKVAVTAISILLTACSQIGANRLESDNVSYIGALSDAQKKQMLANIIRIRYLDMPVFLDVSSVLTQYSFGGSASTGYLSDNGFTGSSVNAGVSGSYSERPTITFLPLSGHDFAIRMMRPIPVEFVFAIAQGGWPVEVLMGASLQRMNNVENMSFGVIPSPGSVDLSKQYDRDLQAHLNFQKMLNLMLVLSDKDAIEVQRSGPNEQLYLVFEPNPDDSIKQQMRDLKQQLSLDLATNKFAITDKIAHRSDKEITVKTRGLLPIMSVMSRGTVIPDAHQDSVVDTKIDPNQLPMTIKSSKEYPEDSFIAVEYRDHWFYIEHDDITSKRYFGLMMYLYNIQAPAKAQQAPLLTLPTG
ncbi:hypothetical protein [Echinimonas agarilytica]|uniref:Uncharacterized protein n=1 Tax=Echinimonas agarilytica TaxID=1215918 RepID=A0AA42B7R5_9GAMM|nr:hypothetical protein [Echinimonas agarilytica]MCM2680077.1 hypothetical protein [Echinimonas agarilytica]